MTGGRMHGVMEGAEFLFCDIEGNVSPGSLTVTLTDRFTSKVQMNTDSTTLKPPTFVRQADYEVYHYRVRINQVGGAPVSVQDKLGSFGLSLVSNEKDADLVIDVTKNDIKFSIRPNLKELGFSDLIPLHSLPRSVEIDMWRLLKPALESVFRFLSRLRFDWNSLKDKPVAIKFFENMPNFDGEERNLIRNGKIEIKENKGMQHVLMIENMSADVLFVSVVYFDTYTLDIGKRSPRDYISVFN